MISLGKHGNVWQFDHDYHGLRAAIIDILKEPIFTGDGSPLYGIYYTPPETVYPCFGSNASSRPGYPPMGKITIDVNARVFEGRMRYFDCGSREPAKRFLRKIRSGSILDEIKDVKFNPPATIVFWNDGTKTVVEKQPDDPRQFDKMTGLALCISKKLYSDNKSKYFEVFKKWCSDDGEEDEKIGGTD